MKEIFFVLVVWPGKVVGGLIGEGWALVALAAMFAAGAYIFRAVEYCLPRAAAVTIGVIAGLYVGVVMWEAQKWTAIAMLERYDHQDDD